MARHTSKAHAHGVRRGARRVACWPGLWRHRGRPQGVPGASGGLLRPPHHRRLAARQALMVRQPGGRGCRHPPPGGPRPHSGHRQRRTCAQGVLCCAACDIVGWDAHVSPDDIRCDVPGVACPDGAARTGMLHDRWDTHTGLDCLSVGTSMGCAWGRHRRLPGAAAPPGYPPRALRHRPLTAPVPARPPGR
jgi:hypothetical protein